MISRVIDYRLEVNRYNQVNLFGQNHGDLYDEDILAYVLDEADAAGIGTTNDDKTETKTLLSHRSYGCNRRHWLSLAPNVGHLISLH